MNDRNIDNGILIHDPEMEMVVAASLMVSARNFAEVSDILTPDCFHDLKLREVFEAVRDICNRGEVADMVLVGDELSRRGSKVTRTEVVELCVRHRSCSISASMH